MSSNIYIKGRWCFWITLQTSYLMYQLSIHNNVNGYVEHHCSFIFRRTDIKQYFQDIDGLPAVSDNFPEMTLISNSWQPYFTSVIRLSISFTPGVNTNHSGEYFETIDYFYMICCVPRYAILPGRNHCPRWVHISSKWPLYIGRGRNFSITSGWIYSQSDSDRWTEMFCL